CRLGFARSPGLDERPACVAVTDQPFTAGDAEFIGHRVGGGFAGVRYRDDDRIVTIEIESAVGAFGFGQFFAQPCAAEVDAAVIERAGDVGEVDPFKETVSRRAWLSE